MTSTYIENFNLFISTITQESNNIKYPTFNNPNLSNTKITINYKSLIDDLLVCISLNENFLDKFDSLFIKEKINFSNEIMNELINCKLNLLDLRIGYYFFQRKLQIIQYFFEKFSFEKIKSSMNNDVNILLTNFINEHQNTIYLDNIGIFKNKFLDFYKKEENFLNELGQIFENFNPCITILNFVIKFTIGIYADLFNLFSFFLGIETIKEIEENKLVNFFYSLHQLDIINKVIINYFLYSKKNLLDLDENTSEIWLKIKKNFIRFAPFSKEQAIKLLDKLNSVVSCGYAGMSKGREGDKNEIIKKAESGFYMSYFFFNKNEAKTQSMRFLINPDNKISRDIWNLLDTKGLKTGYKLFLPSIKYSQKWRIKKLENELDLNEIYDLTNKIKKDDFIINISKKQTNKIDMKKKISIEAEEEEPFRTAYIESIIKSKCKNKEEKKDFVKINLISTSDIEVPTNNEIKIFNCCVNTSLVNKSKNIKYDSLLIHIHGGGFVSMSASSHESYTRKWVKDLNVPLISINYSLSPEYSFPKALDDVYQTYIWILKCAEKVFNISPDKIIIIGDSAGGNLALSLTYLLICKNLPLPIALFLAYPSLKLSIKQLNFSHLNSLTDPILEYNLLTFCLESYSGTCDEYNPFLSPLFMDDKILKCLPPIRIYGGTADPLRDDSLLFIERLENVGVDYKMKEFKYFPHGFLSYDSPLMLPEFEIANKMIVEEIKTFLFS